MEVETERLLFGLPRAGSSEASEAAAENEGAAAAREDRCTTGWGENVGMGKRFRGNIGESAILNSRAT